MFFMVLDLRLTKRWGHSGAPFFMSLSFYCVLMKNSNNLSRFLKKTYTFACLKRNEEN